MIITCYDQTMRQIHAQQMIRFDRWAANGFPGCDRYLPHILNAFASLPGVAPRFSCASHPGRGQLRFYVMFVATAEGLRHLIAVHAIVSRFTRYGWHDESLKLSTFLAALPVADGVIPFQCAVLDIQLKDKATKIEFLQILQTAVVTYATELGYLLPPATAS